MPLMCTRWAVLLARLAAGARLVAAGATETAMHSDASASDDPACTHTHAHQRDAREPCVMGCPMRQSFAKSGWEFFKWQTGALNGHNTFDYPQNMFRFGLH